MSSHTEYTGHVGPVVEGKKYLSTNKPPRVFTADIHDVGIGKIRFVIDSEREVEDPEPEHPTAGSSAIAALICVLCAPAVAAAALIARSLGHPPMPRDLTQAQVQHEVNR